MRNFANRLFNESSAVQRVIAAYLSAKGVNFDDAVIQLVEEGGSRTLTSEQMNRSPLRVFQRLESLDPSRHNVELLFEFVWQALGDDGGLWEELAWNTVITLLYNACITQFPGFGSAISMQPLRAGQAVARTLVPGDRVVNLNYDTVFDLALQQAGRFVVYSPERPSRGSIVVYKPHGSFNLYSDRATGDSFFSDPSQIKGSVALRDASGRTWSPAASIVPPRLGKSYVQHPAAKMILQGLTSFTPAIVTFWGVGLTSSDIDLLNIYRAACANAVKLEFVNPDAQALAQAERLLSKPMHYFECLSDWLAASQVEQ